jgi:O-antigen ligase
LQRAVIQVLIITILLIGPLFYGGNRPLPLLFLSLIAIALLAHVAIAPRFYHQLNKLWLLLLGLLVALPILQLIPIPFSWWQHLPAQQHYAQALEIALAQSDSNTILHARPLSLVPDQTEYALLALLPPMAIFLVCIGLKTSLLRGLVPIFLGMAAFQALLALMEYGIGHSANGTFVNRDHLAGFLEMALPMSVAMLVASLGQAKPISSHKRSFRDRLRVFIYNYCNRTVLYGAIALAVLLGLIFTQSRTGVGLAMLIILICAVLFSKRLGGNNAYGMVGTYAAIGISLAVLIGLVPVLDRFVLNDHMQDARWVIYATMQQVIADSLPFGTGVGSFAEVFPRYHPVEITGVVVNRAHNDYLEWIMEGGVVAAMLIIGFLSLYVMRWRALWLSQRWDTFHFIQIAAGIGLLAILLHSLVDFNLRIPANQIYFAFIAALFFHQVKAPLQTNNMAQQNATEVNHVQAQRHSSERQSATHHSHATQQTAAQMATALGPQADESAPDAVKQKPAINRDNPFAD